jgi:hypothetical protein
LTGTPFPDPLLSTRGALRYLGLKVNGQEVLSNELSDKDMLKLRKEFGTESVDARLKEQQALQAQASAYGWSRRHRLKAASAANKLKNLVGSHQQHLIKHLFMRCS